MSKKEVVRHYEYQCNGYAIRHTSGSCMYTVEHESGYQSWSPVEPFNKTYKLSETFLDRLHIERDELNERCQKLDAFISIGFDELAGKVGSKQAALLILQCSFMKNYLEVLEARIIDAEKDYGEAKKW